MNKTRTAATLGCMAAAVLAAPSSYGQESGWYVGAGIGRSAATIDNDRITRGLAGQGLSTTSIDDRDTEPRPRVLSTSTVPPSTSIRRRTR